MEKIAKILAGIAKKAACRSVGKSLSVGVYEVKPPRELLDKKGCTQNEYPMQ